MKIEFSKPKRRVLAAVAVVLAGVLLSVTAKDGLAEPLRVGVNRGVHSALVYVADAQGFFKNQGVDVLISEYEAGVLAVNDFIADKVDIATASDFAFVVQSLKYPDVRMPASICMASDSEFVVRKDRGIARPQDLKGKRVALLRGGQTEFFLHNYLIFNRIPAESVKIVDLAPSQIVKAMADGTIDAALSWPPFSSEMAKRLGANGARWPAQSGQDYYQVLFAKEGFMKKQPKTMERFLAALLEAEGFIAKYPDRVQGILLNRLKADRVTLLSTWGLYRFRLQLTQDLLVLMEREAKWAIRSGLVEKKTMPNYLHSFHFEALEKVKPEAVSIVH
jgi:ABC-type nitrate/sulfonate/bicarbonate transport system substrate-binding protein